MTKIIDIADPVAKMFVPGRIEIIKLSDSDVKQLQIAISILEHAGNLWAKVQQSNDGNPYREAELSIREAIEY